MAERTTVYDYDARSRYKNRETNALDHTQDNAYDPVSGVLDSTTGPNGLTTTWGQDAFGRTTREKLVTANPFLATLTAGDLKSWADRKMRGL